MRLELVCWRSKNNLKTQLFQVLSVAKAIIQSYLLPAYTVCTENTDPIAMEYGSNEVRSVRKKRL